MSNKLAGFILANRHPHITCPSQPLPPLLLLLLIIDQVMLQQCVMLARRQHTLSLAVAVALRQGAGGAATSLAMLTLPLSIFHTSHKGSTAAALQAPGERKQLAKNG